MYKFKGFDSTDCGDSMSALEVVVNAWMQEEHPRVRHMCQTIRGEHILLSFVYEDTRELEQRVATQAQVAITGSFPRFFDDEVVIEDRPTSPRIPATPPMH
ncbi:MAG: hypothetical protein NVS4B11_05830 [Ktedonobacteraceae bacterium]